MLPALLVTILALGGTEPDIYEPDDTPEEASSISIDAPAQTHNFHDSGDEDWLQFRVENVPTILTFETLNLESNADTSIRVFEDDGETLIDEDDNSGLDGNGASGLLIQFTSAGTYFLQVTNAQGLFGADTCYDVRIILEAGFLIGSIVGMVTDVTDDSQLLGAELVLSGDYIARAINDNQGYAFDVLDGNYTIEASFPGYATQSNSINVSDGGFFIVDFQLEADISDPFDLNGDMNINSVDIQLVILDVLGTAPMGTVGDVNRDMAVNSVDVQLLINQVLGIVPRK